MVSPKGFDDLLKAGLGIITPKVFPDSRGYFFEAFNKARFNESFGNVDFIQDNESMSSRGVIRGLHYQAGEHAQAKLVRVIKGKVIDFVVDIRKSSKYFGNLFMIELSGENKYQFFIPRGFAHGFICLEDNTIFSYKCDNYWNKESERGINILDKDLDIFEKIGKFYEPINKDELIFSEKDQLHPNFKNAVDLFD